VFRWFEITLLADETLCKCELMGQQKAVLLVRIPFGTIF